MQQSQERFNYLLQTLDQYRMSINLDELTPQEREANDAIIAHLEAELSKYGLKFDNHQNFTSMGRAAVRREGYAANSGMLPDP